MLCKTCSIDLKKALRLYLLPNVHRQSISNKAETQQNVEKVNIFKRQQLCQFSPPPKILLKSFHGISLDGALKQTSAAITIICPVIYPRLLCAEVTLAVKATQKRLSKPHKRNAGRRTFCNIPCIHTQPASFACRRAHARTHWSHTSHLYSPCAAVDRVPLPHPPSPSLPPSPPRCSRSGNSSTSSSVIQPASTYCSRPHNTNNPPGNRNGVCLIIIFI